MPKSSLLSCTLSEWLLRSRLDSATFAGKNGFRSWSLVLKIAKKVNKLQPSLAFLPEFGEQKISSLPLGVWCPSTPTTLSSALLLSAPLHAAAWFGHSSEVCKFLAVLISIHYLSSPLSPSGDFPPLTRTALEEESKVSSFSAPHSGVSGRLTACTAHSIFQVVLGPLLLPQQAWIVLTGSDGQAAFPLSVTVPDGKKSSVNMRQVNSRENKWSRHGLQSSCNACLFFHLDQGLETSESEANSFRSEDSNMSGFCSHLGAGSDEPQEERSLGVSSGLWSAAPPLQHSSNKLKPEIKAKLKRLK